MQVLTVEGPRTRAFDVLEFRCCAPGGALPTFRMVHPCLSCGACCAYFRVAFHWSEADASLSGVVPPALTETLDPHRLVMRGTQASRPRCTALQGTVGDAAHCGIYESRPSVCREVEPSWEFGRPSAQCDKARLGHGLSVLTPDDWAVAATAA